MTRAALAAVLIAVPHAAALAADEQVTLSTGADYTSGKYGGTERTDIFYVPFSGKYETGLWTYKLVVPYIRITGPGNVSGAGEDRVALGGGNGTRRTESGLGDIVASAFYNVLSGRNAQLGLDIGGKIKFGTADQAKGLGTGENDFSLQADLFKPIGALTVFGTLGYRWYGDPPGVDLHDVFFGSVGGAYKVSQLTTVGLAYDFREPIIAGGGHVSELTAYLSQRLDGGWKLQYYVLKGFADASPDYGFGVAFSKSY